MFGLKFEKRGDLVLLEEYIQKKINDYFTHLKSNDRNLETDVFCELIKQWAFDYNIENTKTRES